MKLQAHKARRRGATVVEAAFVLPIMLLLLFGAFEYCRFIFLLQVCENAAREGARYAVTRTADGTTMADIQNYTTSRMAVRARPQLPGRGLQRRPAHRQPGPEHQLERRAVRRRDPGPRQRHLHA